MTKAVGKVLDPLGLTKKVVPGLDKKDGAPMAGVTAPAGNAAAAEALQEKQVATREQDLRAAAAAAGATRSGNQRDWLSGGPVRAKRKDAAKALLGE